jgi:hypothetical protein
MFWLNNLPTSQLITDVTQYKPLKDTFAENGSVVIVLFSVYSLVCPSRFAA